MPKHHAKPKHRRHEHIIPAYVQVFIDTHAAKAQEINKKMRIPASVLLAQACLESDFGRRAPDNSYFGIKGKSPSGQTAAHATHEVVSGNSVPETDNFRAYKDFDEAADDYADFLVNHPNYFAAAFRHVDNSVEFARAMGKSKYATDPSYGPKLMNIIRSNKLARYDVLPAAAAASAAH